MTPVGCRIESVGDCTIHTNWSTYHNYLQITWLRFRFVIYSANYLHFDKPKTVSVLFTNASFSCLLCFRSGSSYTPTSLYLLGSSIKLLPVTRQRQLNMVRYHMLMIYYVAPPTPSCPWVITYCDCSIYPSNFSFCSITSSLHTL